MPIIILENTDLFTVETECLAQGCNTKGLMGAGIAYEFRHRYPEMHEDYVNFCICHDDMIGDMHVYVQGEGDEKLTFFNLFTQINPGRDARVDACYHAFKRMFTTMQRWGRKSVAMPAIGCGIGGLKWPDVMAALQLAYHEVGYDCEVKVAFN